MKHVFTTTNGVEVPIRAISLVEMQLATSGLREELIAQGLPLDPPEYTVELAGGAKQSFPHDQTTLKTDEDKAAWDAHQVALATLRRENGQLVQEYVFEEGIAVELPADANWEAKQKRRHIKVPEDPKQKRDHYLLTEILRTQADIAGCIAAVLELSGEGSGKERELKAALNTFRNPVERPAA